jgi:hypothetical protein
VRCRPWRQESADAPGAWFTFTWNVYNPGGGTFTYALEALALP